ncbi:MAG: hypothetical protein A3F67_00225 [Verrucomicrobia bacterium RIFCSPHIGHO2_12_FULL_41_10]|nr:MAG: hypothetical protein A3F67_00225 [Verrucomicrobia bacterium RIFCSPHIGHO2_12_FULL_41_10]HLB33630.1 hypothetical protein [Chthoniobacterales bacterium]
MNKKPLILLLSTFLTAGVVCAVSTRVYHHNATRTKTSREVTGETSADSTTKSRTVTDTATGFTTTKERTEPLNDSVTKIAPTFTGQTTTPSIEWETGANTRNVEAIRFHGGPVTDLNTTTQPNFIGQNLTTTTTAPVATTQVTGTYGVPLIRTEATTLPSIMNANVIRAEEQINTSRAFTAPTQEERENIKERRINRARPRNSNFDMIRR